MSTHAAPLPAVMATDASSSTASLAGKSLVVGGIGLALTAIGTFVSDPHGVALSYLVGVTYWTAITIGMLLMVLIVHLRVRLERHRALVDDLYLELED